MLPRPFRVHFTAQSRVQVPRDWDASLTLWMPSSVQSLLPTSGPPPPPPPSSRHKNVLQDLQQQLLLSTCGICCKTCYYFVHNKSVSTEQSVKEEKRGKDAKQAVFCLVHPPLFCRAGCRCHERGRSLGTLAGMLQTSLNSVLHPFFSWRKATNFFGCQLFRCSIVPKIYPHPSCRKWGRSRVGWGHSCI